MNPQRPSSAFRYEESRDEPANVLQELVAPSCFDVVQFCQEFGLKRDHIARMTSYAPRTVAAWAAGKPIVGAAWQKVTELRRLTAALARLVPPAAVGAWMQAPNARFQGSTPIQLVERGESDRLWLMIYLLESGQPG